MSKIICMASQNSYCLDMKILRPLIRRTLCLKKRHCFGLL